MEMSRLRRSVAVITSAALLASLVVATVASPASAAKPKCQGKTATIVGTRKSDIIRGTAKRDIIVARGGNDRIYAKGGNDIICAGGGNDVVYGGPGADRLWGQLGHDKLNGNAGNDFLAGQVGNDRLNGGINYDTCFQGTGTGAVANCESPGAAPAPTPPPPPPAAADLRVDVYGPPVIINSAPGVYEVTVTNLGPSSTAYTLTHSLEASRDGCSVATDQSGEKPVMAPHEEQTWDYKVTCIFPSVTTTFVARAEPLGGPVDPAPADNADSQYTEWYYLG